VHDAVEDGDVPAAPVQVDVVTTAQQRQVRDFGVAAVDPGDQVVGVGPTPFSRTPVTVV